MPPPWRTSTCYLLANFAINEMAIAEPPTPVRRIVVNVAPACSSKSRIKQDGDIVGMIDYVRQLAWIEPRVTGVHEHTAA